MIGPYMVPFDWCSRPLVWVDEHWPLFHIRFGHKVYRPNFNPMSISPRRFSS